MIKGASSFLTQISIMVNMTVMNTVLVTYGAASKYGADLPLSVIGIVQKVFGIMISITVGLAAAIVFECFPLQTIRLFGAQEGLYNEYAIIAFRVYFSTSILCCVQKGTSIFMQALEKPVLSMELSLLRDFVLCVSLILLLPLKLGIYGPLFSAPISDIFSMFAVFGVIGYLKKLLNASSCDK